MVEQSIIACICEGAAERAVIDLLLDDNALYFKRHQLLDDKIIRVRNAQRFEEQYLRKQFNDKITVIRILDSKNEKFKLSEAYKDKIEIINIITSPEIEMLIIHNEGMFEEYKKSRKKPSDYCKQDLEYRYVKNYEFVKDYFSDVDALVKAIRKHHKIYLAKDKKSNTLYDLLDR